MHRKPHPWVGPLRRKGECVKILLGLGCSILSHLPPQGQRAPRRETGKTRRGAARNRILSQHRRHLVTTPARASHLRSRVVCDPLPPRPSRSSLFPPSTGQRSCPSCPWDSRDWGGGRSQGRGEAAPQGQEASRRSWQAAAEFRPQLPRMCHQARARTGSTRVSWLQAQC